MKIYSSNIGTKRGNKTAKNENEKKKKKEKKKQEPNKSTMTFQNYQHNVAS